MSHHIHVKIHSKQPMSRIKFVGILVFIAVAIFGYFKREDIKRLAYERISNSDAGKTISYLVNNVKPFGDIEGIDSLRYTMPVIFHSDSAGSTFEYIDELPFGLSDKDRLIVSIKMYNPSVSGGADKMQMDTYRGLYIIKTRFNIPYMKYVENVEELPGAGGLDKKTADEQLRMFTTYIIKK